MQIDKVMTRKSLAHVARRQARLRVLLDDAANADLERSMLVHPATGLTLTVVR